MKYNPVDICNKLINNVYEPSKTWGPLGTAEIFARAPRTSPGTWEDHRRGLNLKALYTLSQEKTRKNEKQKKSKQARGSNT